MKTRMEMLKEIMERHEERMQNDPLYRMTCLLMQQATETREPSRHYDRDGYCDNPARGY